MYVKNKRGPSTVPCGTPEITFAFGEHSPLVTICCVIAVRKSLNHPRSLPRMPQWSSFRQSSRWQTLSNALLKYSSNDSNCLVFRVVITTTGHP